MQPRKQQWERLREVSVNHLCIQTNNPNTSKKQEQSFWGAKVSKDMQNEHFVFNFLCYFDLLFKKATKQKQKNQHDCTAGWPSRRTLQGTETDWKRKREWNLSMTNTDGDRVRQTWEQDKSEEKINKTTKYVETCTWDRGFILEA